MTVVREFTLPMPLGDPRHGTITGYVNHRCRCQECRAANTAYRLPLQRARRFDDPDDPRHGTEYGYSQWNCRCAACTAAHAAYKRAYRRARAAP